MTVRAICAFATTKRSYWVVIAIFMYSGKNSIRKIQLFTDFSSNKVLVLVNVSLIINNRKIQYDQLPLFKSLETYYNRILFDV